MPASFRPFFPNQTLLMPPALQEWLPEGHLAYFIADTVASLDLAAFYRRYEEGGARNQPFEPRMMVGLWLYAYATGTFSSRRIAKKLDEDVAYRMLAAGNRPAHRTLAEFRQENLAALESLLVQVVGIAREAGVKRLGMLAVDGTKLRANASKHKAMSYGRMREEEERLRREIAELSAKAAAVDAAEDQEYGADQRGDELPAELQRREQRLATIRAAKARLEQRQADADREQGRSPEAGRKGKGRKPFAREFGVPADSAQENFTDPQSRVMKTGQGFQQCYNGHAAVEEGSQLIVAAELTNCAADSGQIVPLVEAATAAAGGAPEEVTADAGFRSEANFAQLEARGIKAYISLGREGKLRAKTDCPPGPATAAMAARLATEPGKSRYRRRKAIVEPVFGWIKHVLGFRQFSLRGQAKAQAEWRMVCTAVNLRRMHRSATG